MATMEPAEGEIKRDCWTVAFGQCMGTRSALGVNGVEALNAGSTNLSQYLEL